MEFKDYRYKTVELYNKYLDKDKSKFHKYSFLKACGEPIDENLEKDDLKFHRNLKYLCIGILILCIAGFLFSGTPGNLSDYTSRPEYGKPDSEFTVNLEMNYENEKHTSQETIKVPAKEITASQAYKKLKECEDWVSGEVFGGELPYSISSSIELPGCSEDKTVQIVWDSSDERRISSEGLLNAIGLKEPETVVLRAVFILEDYTIEKHFAVYVNPENIKDYSGSMAIETGNLLKEISEDMRADKVLLPEVSSGGASLKWKLPGRVFPSEFIALGVLAALALMFTRHDGLEHRLKRMGKEFETDLSDLSLQLILLLNAGLVSDAAFGELAEMNKDSKSPLYKAILSLKRQSADTNVPFVYTLYSYAQTTGCREFIRFANLVMDSSGKGSELAEKLERERAQQWGSRLNAAKAKAREAETKLCFPLTLLLLVLVIISVSPALMEM